MLTTTTIDTKNANNNTTIDHNKINIKATRIMHYYLNVYCVYQVKDDDSDVRLVKRQ